MYTPRSHLETTMSSWVVTDDTPTATVVWTAAEEIGKAQNHEQLQKICDYLANKHWFQTAADLRSARREATEWQALEVPGRLKLAIQQVLDQTTIHQESYGYEDYYAAVRPSLTPGSESITQQWADATAEYGSIEAEQATADYYATGYEYTPSDATYTSSAQYDYEQINYSATSNPPAYDESSTANYDNYYTSSYTSTSSNDDSGAAATTLLSLHKCGEQVGGEQYWCDESEVVEAHAIEAEVAEECEEGELAPDQSSYRVELGEPSQDDINETSGRWSCGQCTYLNPMTSSFCEMCISHISQSPDVKTAAGTSTSASLLIPAKPMVDVVMDSPRTEPSVSSTVENSQPSVACMLPPLESLFRPSAPDFESSEIPEEERIDSSPLPPPPAYPGTTSCGNVDFLALAFSGSSAPKKQAPPGPSSTGKTSLMRREEVTNTTEYTF